MVGSCSIYKQEVAPPVDSVLSTAVLSPTVRELSSIMAIDVAGLMGPRSAAPSAAAAASFAAISSVHSRASRTPFAPIIMIESPTIASM